MNRILELSETGFKLELVGWLSCDKFKVLNKDKFKQLKVNDDIESFELNKKGYVIDFKVLNHKDKGEEVIRSQITSLNVSSRNVNSVCNPSLPSSLPIVEGVSILERGNLEHLNPQFKASSNSVQDSIRYAQAVNLAFNSTNLNGFESEDKWISFTFDRADKIFKEFNARCSR